MRARVCVLPALSVCARVCACVPLCLKLIKLKSYFYMGLYNGHCVKDALKNSDLLDLLLLNGHRVEGRLQQ